jgi:hypothetical protein
VGLAEAAADAGIVAAAAAGCCSAASPLTTCTPIWHPPVPRTAEARHAPVCPPCREKQAALAAEEARRKAAVRASAAKFCSDIGGQLGEKEAARVAALREKRAELVAMMADLEVGGGGGDGVG